MMGVNHENIVKFYTHFEDPKHICIVLELADKNHLLAKLRIKGVIQEKVVASYLF